MDYVFKLDYQTHLFILDFGACINDLLVSLIVSIF